MLTNRFIVFFIRNKATPEFLHVLIKELGLFCVKRKLFLISRKKNLLNFRKKKNVKLEKKAVLIKKIVQFLGFRKPH